ncbi:MAG: trypsin-like peptidase domain-containing protein [Ginsengibacter sp.]
MLIFSLLLFSSFSFGQNLLGKLLEKTIDAAIQKSYAACVKIWAFDTTSKEQMSATFSGVVVTKDGHILTAAHVIMPGNTYQVAFPDGKKCIAIALGKITKTQIVPDVGMMKIISPGYWPFAKMGHSYTLRMYEPCISISYPESLYQDLPTVRFGYITNTKNEKGFIQSTCIMEPGDSGGPLFDYDGNVIGLHSAIEVSEKMNFDIPVDLYREYWQALNIPRIYHSFPKSLQNENRDSINQKVFVVDTNNIYGSSFQKIIIKNSKTCVKITSGINGKSQEALGTLVYINLKNHRENFIISKSSIVLNDSILIETAKRKFYASVIARDEDNDLILLKPSSNIKGGISFAKFSVGSSIEMEPGRFIVSLLPNASGLYSTTGSGFIKMNKFFSSPSFGASILFKDSKVVLNKIQPGSPADKEGMKTGDVILAFNNIPIANPGDFFSTLNQFWPGDTVVLKLKRSETIFEKTIILRQVAIPLSEHPADHFDGGSSRIRDGFNKVFTHDAIIHPEMCGGPIFDANGTFYGINIARHSRASTLGMPASIIGKFISDALQLK